MAGIPRHARQVGYALSALRDDDDALPWHRVVNAKGEISRRAASDSHTLQRRLLESEGVAFDSVGRIAMSRFQWRPRPTAT